VTHAATWGETMTPDRYLPESVWTKEARNLRRVRRSRERECHYLGGAILCSASVRVTQGNLGGPVRQAHERRRGEGRAIAEVGKTLERGKPRRASRGLTGNTGWSPTSSEAGARPWRQPTGPSTTKPRSKSKAPADRTHLGRRSVRKATARRVRGGRKGTRLVTRRTLWRVESQECQRGEINPQGGWRSKPLGGWENLEAERTGWGKPGVVDSEHWRRCRDGKPHGRSRPN